MMVAADRRSSGWFWLVQVAASVEAALLFVAGAYLRDAEALAFAFVVLLTVDFVNNDLFWHTFTVTQLGVDIRLPVKGNQRLSFNAAPGTYEFFCAIPGHKGIGMRGTLVIR